MNVLKKINKKIVLTVFLPLILLAFLFIPIFNGESLWSLAEGKIRESKINKIAHLANTYKDVEFVGNYAFAVAGNNNSIRPELINSISVTKDGENFKVVDSVDDIDETSLTYIICPPGSTPGEKNCTNQSGSSEYQELIQSLVDEGIFESADDVYNISGSYLNTNGGKIKSLAFTSNYTIEKNANGNILFIHVPDEGDMTYKIINTEGKKAFDFTEFVDVENPDGWYYISFLDAYLSEDGYGKEAAWGMTAIYENVELPISYINLSYKSGFICKPVAGSECEKNYGLRRLNYSFENKFDVQNDYQLVGMSTKTVQNGYSLIDGTEDRVFLTLANEVGDIESYQLTEDGDKFTGRTGYTYNGVYHEEFLQSIIDTQKNHNIPGSGLDVYLENFTRDELNGMEITNVEFVQDGILNSSPGYVGLAQTLGDYKTVSELSINYNKEGLSNVSGTITNVDEGNSCRTMYDVYIEIPLNETVSYVAQDPEDTTKDYTKIKINGEEVEYTFDSERNVLIVTPRYDLECGKTLNVEFTVNVKGESYTPEENYDENYNYYRAYIDLNIRWNYLDCDLLVDEDEIGRYCSVGMFASAAGGGFVTWKESDPVYYTLVVHHYEVNGNTPLSEADEVNDEKQSGESYSTSKASITGYDYVKVEGDPTSGTMNSDKTVIYYYEKQDKTLIVKHVYEDSGENIVEPSSQTLKYGDSYSTSPLSASDIPENYELVETPSNASGTMNDDVTVTYEYKKKEGKVIVKYLEQGTDKEIKSTEETTYDYGESYTVSKGSVDSSYEFVEVVGNESGTVNQEEITIIYYYKLKSAKVITRHLEHETGNVLAPEETKNYNYNESYTTSSKEDELPYYEVVESVGVTSGTVNQDEIIVTYYYQLKKTTVTIEYRDYDTDEELSESISYVDLYMGSTYQSVEADNIPEEYEFSHIEGNDNGIVDEEDKLIIYYYELKSAEVIVNHLEEGTNNVLAAQEVLYYSYTNTYYTEPSYWLDYYELVRVEGEESGVVNQDTIIVTYYYRLKEAKLIVKHLEVNTNKELSPSTEKDVHYGDEYTTEQSTNIPKNYELLEAPTNYKGIIEDDEVEVIYYYKVIDSYISSVIDKTGTEEITLKDELVTYTIKYTVNIDDYLGDAKIQIIDTLPYRIIEDKSNLDGGTYNPSDNTIIWEYEWNDIDSLDETKTKEINLEFSVVYDGIILSERTMINNIVGKTILDNNDAEVVDPHVTYVKVPGTITVHHYYEGTTNKLFDDVVTTNYIGENYASTPVDDKNYIIVVRPENENMTYTEEPQEVIYEYRPLSVKVETKVNGDGGDIVGDEVVKYGESSTKDNIVITPNEGYEIKTIIINGKTYTPEGDYKGGVIIPYFENMIEDKLIVVEFEKVQNPNTIALSIILPVIALLISVVIRRNLKRRYS